MTGADTNERAPVFMQFLDAVHQFWHKNPSMFEFNQRYLMKLAQHQYSGLFGTFLFNNHREMLAEKHNSLISIFDYLGKHSPTFLNPVYDNKKSGRLLFPKGMWELQVWREVYCCSDVEQIVNNPVSSIVLRL
jgi:myotubularin-related protein 3/4